MQTLKEKINRKDLIKTNQNLNDIKETLKQIPKHGKIIQLFKQETVKNDLKNILNQKLKPLEEQQQNIEKLLEDDKNSYIALKNDIININNNNKNQKQKQKHKTKNNNNNNNNNNNITYTKLPNTHFQKDRRIIHVKNLSFNPV